MKIWTIPFLFLVFGGLSDGLILVPEEVQTVLQLVYSYLPTLRTGTDSKIGVGFRLGRNADVQLVLELGPQTTKNGSNSNSRRRDVSSANQTTRNTNSGRKINAETEVRSSTVGQQVSQQNTTKTLSSSTQQQSGMARLVNAIRSMLKEQETKAK